MPTGTDETVFASSVILPGLVNAHTHLEFSDLSAPLGSAGMEFTDWIGEVIRFRGRAGRASKADVIKIGLEQSARYGVAAIGEIATTPLVLKDYAGALPCPASVQVFFEQLGSDDGVIDQKISEAEQFFADSPWDSVSAALSPHAPYSVGDRLFDSLMSLARQKQCSVSMHLAETRAEREFVENKTGPFLDMLRSFDVWRPTAYGRYGSILSILKEVARCASSLIIHGNYLTMDELDFIATVRDRMSVVFCPRTHAYFGHARYPLEEMLDRAINVAVGTDSLASNPDLDLLWELKEIHRRHPEVPIEKIVEIGTINGAEALGLDKSFGGLTTGQIARFCVQQAPETTSPYSWLADTN